LREDYRARIEARLQRAATTTAAATMTATAATTAATTAAGVMSTPEPGKPKTLEEIRRQAREDWLLMRQEASKGLSQSAAAAAVGQTRDRLDDEYLSR
jgi:uncharacterized protein (DUF1684 family)